MIIGKLLYDRLKKLESELRYIKTSHIKTATTIATTYRTVRVNFSLTMADFGGVTYSTKNAIIEATTTDGSDMVCACYIDGLTPAVLDNRRLMMDNLVADQGKRSFRLAVMAGNSQDYDTLYNGGYVDLSYTVRVVGTSEFNLNVRYVDIDGGLE